MATIIRAAENDRVLIPGEVARMLGVDPKTVTRLANRGKLASFRTLGGHRRYVLSNVRAYLDGRQP
jgi:excisionase family DNA binding protein